MKRRRQQGRRAGTGGWVGGRSQLAQLPSPIGRGKSDQRPGLFPRLLLRDQGSGGGRFQQVRRRGRARQPVGPEGGRHGQDAAVVEGGDVRPRLGGQQGEGGAVRPVAPQGGQGEEGRVGGAQDPPGLGVFVAGELIEARDGDQGAAAGRAVAERAPLAAEIDHRRAFGGRGREAEPHRQQFRRAPLPRPHGQTGVGGADLVRVGPVRQGRVGGGRDLRLDEGADQFADIETGFVGGAHLAHLAPSLLAGEGRRPPGPKKRIGDDGAVTDAVNPLTVFMVVRADSHEAAVRLFEGHPHMVIFPCEGVEVMPVLGD